MRTKKRKSQLEYPFHLVNERRREDGVSIISSTPLLSVGMKNIALLLLLFAHFHLSVHTVISGMLLMLVALHVQFVLFFH